MSNNYGVHSGNLKVKNIRVNNGIVEIPSILSMGLGPVMAEDSFPHDATSSTEQTAALCKVSDGGVFLNLAVSGTGGGYTANYQLFPDTEVIGDAVYFGGVSKFTVMSMDMSATVCVYGNDSITWEYYNGSGWASFTPVWDNTDTTGQDGQRPFQQDGDIILNVKADWALTTIDSQIAYWVRARVTVASITTIGLTDSKEHLIVTLDKGGTTVNCSGKIGRGMIRFATLSATNGDTEIILCNMTQGMASVAKTLNKGVADHEIADFGLIINKGDELAVYATEEDGTTEFAGGLAELTVNAR